MQSRSEQIWCFLFFLYSVSFPTSNSSTIVQFEFGLDLNIIMLNRCQRLRCKCKQILLDLNLLTILNNVRFVAGVEWDCILIISKILLISTIPGKILLQFFMDRGGPGDFFIGPYWKRDSQNTWKLEARQPMVGSWTKSFWTKLRYLW